MKKALTVLMMGLVSQAAFAMPAQEVTLKRHQQGHFWLLEPQGDLTVEAKMVEASESVVDALEALDATQDYACRMKFRRMPTYAIGGYLMVMVHELSDCKGRPAAVAP